VYDVNAWGRPTVRRPDLEEPEWDEAERGWMLALAVVEADRCPGCGGALSETTDPDSEGSYRVPEPDRCHRCTAIAQRQDGYREAKHNHALLYHAERT
jgi:hypothetical protein